MKYNHLYFLIPLLLLSIETQLVSSSFIGLHLKSCTKAGPWTIRQQRHDSSSQVLVLPSQANDDDTPIQNNKEPSTSLNSRKQFLSSLLLSTTTTATTINSIILLDPQPSYAKCTDIESCREIGEKKVEQDMIDNPTIRLESGVRYKVLQSATTTTSTTEDLTVQPNSNIDLIFSVSTLSGGYMYSRGFGFEKIDILGNGQLQSDANGLDYLRVQLGNRDVPIGIEDALIGMKRGERRRVELPPRVGFETSDWKPEPTTRRGKTRIVGYRQLLEGNGSTRPAFPAATIWDIEVLRIRK